MESVKKRENNKVAKSMLDNHFGHFKSLQFFKI